MNDPWISVKDDLPKDGELVCVKFWDCHSPHGYGSCLAKIRFGISQEQRDSMKRGELPDPLHEVWSLPYGWHFVRRSSMVSLGDEYGNNAVPYEWECHQSPRTLFGQQVYAWASLSSLNLEVTGDD